VADPSPRARPAYQPVTAPPSLMMGPICQLPLPPNSLCSMPACPRRPNSRRWTGQPSPPRATRRLRCTVASHRRCSSRDVVPGARRRSLAVSAPLAELTWPKARRLDPNVALPTSMPMCAVWPCPAPPPVQCTRANDVRTNSFSVVSMQISCHCPPRCTPTPACARSRCPSTTEH
jgi:hypothetical protein